ncbi:MAG: lysophospholipid acyltransferase family protein [Myxococcota bacterium]|nr:lysophospholipid acyltransferase family protein [Myxococcota bacterium]
MSPIDMIGEVERDRGLSFLVGKVVLGVMGWTFHQETRPEGDKYVIVAFPHTSNWDLVLMLGCSYLADMRISWLGKHTLFRGVGKPFFTWLGGVPVDRTAAKGMVQQVVDAFEERDYLALAIPPEGTRAHADGWKTGFYYIALGANVPIVLSYLDFGKKEAGFGPAIMPSGDIEADFEIFREFYKDKKGKVPEWQAEVKVREKRNYEKPPKKGGALQLVIDSINAMRPQRS